MKTFLLHKHAHSNLPTGQPRPKTKTYLCTISGIIQQLNVSDLHIAFICRIHIDLKMCTNQSTICKCIFRSTQFSMQLLYYIIVSATIVASQSNETSTPSMSPTTFDSVPIKTPVSKSNSTCYSNITEIGLLIERKNPFIQEIFILCPDTVYMLTDGTIDGMNPIIAGSNCIFKCGDDGKSSNGCVLSGGTFQVATFADFEADFKVGIVFQGITFVSGSMAAALLIAPGDVTFIDCIFQVRFCLAVL